MKLNWVTKWYWNRWKRAGKIARINFKDLRFEVIELLRHFRGISNSPFLIFHLEFCFVQGRFKVGLNVPRIDLFIPVCASRVPLTDQSVKAVGTSRLLMENGKFRYFS